jgi:hypothetical protein
MGLNLRPILNCKLPSWALKLIYYPIKAPPLYFDLFILGIFHAYTVFLNLKT